MYLCLVKQAVLEAWGLSSHCVFTHCWEVFKHASLRDVTSLPSGFPGHTLSLSPRGFYVGTCSGAGNRPKVSICLLVFQWLLTLIREREGASWKETERNPDSRGSFLVWHNKCTNFWNFNGHSQAHLKGASMSVFLVRCLPLSHTHFDTFCLTPVPLACLRFMYYAGLF